MRLPLIRNPETGFSADFVTDEHEPDKFHIVQSQDVSSALEYAKNLEKDAEYTKAGIRRGWAHAAHIPEGVQIQLFAKYSKGKPGSKMDDGFWEYAKQQVTQNPDYAYLRTAPRTLMRKAKA